MHVVDPDSRDSEMANADHEIQQGNGMLETWPVGRIVFDQHVFTLPESPKPMRVTLGFWHDDQRLKVDQAGCCQDGHDGMLGPELKASGQPAAARIPHAENAEAAGHRRQAR